MLVSPDPVDFEVQAYGSQPYLETPSRLARVERALLLRKLKRAGVRVVDWNVIAPLDGVVYASLRRQPLRNRVVRMSL